MKGTRALLGTAVALAVGGATLSATASADTQARGPSTERVSLAGDGSQLDGPSREAAISGDGRHVAFATKAQELRCHQNTYTCLALKDRVTGKLTLIPNGGDSSWGTPLLSHDGRYVGHTAGTKSPSPMLYDRETGENVNVGAPGNGTGLLRAVTSDGGQVAYTSGDRFHPAQRLFVRNMATGANEPIDGADDGGDLIGAASLSADGRLLAYQKRSDDGGDIVVRDRATGETAQADGGLGAAGFVQVSENGRTVLFVAEDSTYVYDVGRATARKVAEKPAGSASPDARYAVLAEDDDGTALTLLDVRTGRRTPVGPGGVEPGAVTAHGRQVVFASDATDLVPGDTNARTDVFVRRIR
ncbi:hypothetical protein [Streptomyces aureoverticillatus]|uniref:hypothetical protein n=1 Tax=Streptomyces aureoverticillatus TaxID=66871 RepID=UPI0013DB3748|nr:hypothetical protein [Streptomyces aureoverticillatus]QIB43366.1 hypothetical protein G3H79_10075 [Streptomyces aureoverticillatus]